MKDVLLDEGYDLQILNGDFATGEATAQHMALLLACRKGDFKENPTICVGVATWLKDTDVEGLLGEVKKEFERDGMNVKKVELSQGKLNIDAAY